jgi:hypothetical protein
MPQYVVFIIHASNHLAGMKTKFMLKMGSNIQQRWLKNDHYDEVGSHQMGIYSLVYDHKFLALLQVTDTKCIWLDPKAQHFAH